MQIEWFNGDLTPVVTVTLVGDRIHFQRTDGTFDVTAQTAVSRIICG